MGIFEGIGVEKSLVVGRSWVGEEERIRFFEEPECLSKREQKTLV